MSFHVQKWSDISNGCSDIPSKKEAALVVLLQSHRAWQTLAWYCEEKKGKRKKKMGKKKDEVNKTKGKKARRK